MSYQSVARKYRPKTFQEVVGQETTSKTLTNALKYNRVPHAVLFTGPKGVGKTSMARILSKAINCLNKKNEYTPCLECQVCSEIAAGINIDVIEIDGASNSGVESVRNLIEQTSYSPFKCEFKIYIIDEVHMLSNSAFNALLKILEEPPKHVKFIFATTEHRKIPLTILSRCSRFDLKKISSSLIGKHLEYILKEEEVKFEPDAVARIARNSDGSMRDSQVALDQIISLSKENITQQVVEEILGLTNKALLLKTLKSLFHRNIQPDLIAKLSGSSNSPSAFINDLLIELRNCIMIKEFGSEHVLDLPDNEIDKLNKLVKNSSSEDIHLMFDMALKGAFDLSKCENSQVVLEMILIRMANAPKVEALADMMNQNAQNIDKHQAPSHSHPSLSDFVNHLEKQGRGYIAALLGNCRFDKITDQALVLSLDDIKNSVEFENINKHKDKIENLIQDFYGQKLTLEINKTQKDHAYQSPNEKKRVELMKKKNELMQNIQNEAVVKDLKKVFDAEVVKVQADSTH